MPSAAARWRGRYQRAHCTVLAAERRGPARLLGDARQRGLRGRSGRHKRGALAPRSLQATAPAACRVRERRVQAACDALRLRAPGSHVHSLALLPDGERCSALERVLNLVLPATCTGLRSRDLSRSSGRCALMCTLAKNCYTCGAVHRACTLLACAAALAQSHSPTDAQSVLPSSSLRPRSGIAASPTSLSLYCVHV